MRTDGVVREDDARFIGRDGRAMPVEYSASAVRDHGKAVGAVIAFRDTTERKALQEELVRHAYYDSLTGLANRGLLMERLAAALGRASLDHKTHAMIFVDIDRFKAVNDNLGHTTGNDLLREVADRLRSAVSQRDLVARFGGDEFVVLVEDVSGIEEAIASARRICAAVEQPLVLPGGFEHVASVSVGIALTEPGQSADDILRNADVAMFEAKTKGRGGAYKVFDLAAMGPRSRRRLELESALRKGLDRDEIEVHYQPFFSVEEETIVGAEALVRWRHPTEGLIPPDMFIPMAEETGLILPLGRVVLERACEQARLVRDQLGVDLAMSVNLSPRQFQHSGLLSEVAAALDSVGLPSEAITFEITEMMVMEDVEGATDIMKKLSRLGVRIAVDDFLVEHSTFSYLKRFPVDEVKIDRTFVQGVATDPVDTAIVQAIARLADAMCIEAVAEGVENADQLSALRMLGCPIAQGYYLSKPLPPTEFLELVTSRFAPRLDSLAEQPLESPVRLHPQRLVG
jgi:diguanylate cyclase (GGDEF)-like protein